MAGFAINRKDQNKGVHNGRGLWLFDEFMFADSVFGRAEVAYTPRVDGRECDIIDRRVESLVIFDDDGNDIPLTDEARTEAERAVLEDFEDQIDDVIEAEVLLG